MNKKAWMGVLGIAMVLGSTAARAGVEAEFVCKEDRHRLDVQGQSLDKAVPLITYEDNDQPNQAFAIEEAKDFPPGLHGPVYRIKTQPARVENMCVDVTMGSLEDGARLIQFPCWGSLQPNQLFIFIPYDLPGREHNQIFQIMNVKSQKCLTSNLAHSEAGYSQVVQMSCSDMALRPKQLWRIHLRDEKGERRDFHIKHL